MRKMMKINIRGTSLLLLTVIIANAFLIQPAMAANLTALSDTMTRMSTSTASNHTIKFTTPTGVSAGQTITITFPAGFTMGSVAFGDVDMTSGASTGAETEVSLAAVANTATWGAAVAGQVLTLTSATGTITAGHKVIIEIGTNATSGATGTNQVTNPASANTYLISLGGTMADSGKVAVAIISNDQVAVTASVDPTFTFSISANSTAFGTMTTGAIATGGTNVVITAATNANSGFAISVKDAGNGTNPGLYNAGTNTMLASSTTTLVAGTEGYGINAACSGGCSVTSPYSGTGNAVGALSLTSQSLATYASATTANHTVTVTHKAAIATTSRPGAYTDTLTYYATANF